ncbi:acyl dehydratase [Gordonia sp. JH63]|uniref:MaoC family dehydratase n=1 Tax=Gordonia hongkongensis TaxID=1701090 RepID=A0ABT6BWM4_9ACTN|nr:MULTISPECIES: MaoC family dehydratase [Gordonia]MBN0972420.1 acyl dehydratase [Gordonia sp. BP-119]MBN0982526.1 acyl dehydratase [Gordonia sp. BP-94]MBR7194152.1 acyl dehydratase [Gordonia sp. SCSIO 19800]MCT1351942.1 MaoC family dehydratase [Gordonia sp. p3-SID1431]MDF6102408.1 MaoC family dehydratase [Gordonia hongkongensis]
MSASEPVAVGGPFFDELSHGQLFDDAPSLTLTSGLAATHQAILGDRLRLSLDAHLSDRVVGGVLAHPGLVTDVAIGQSTLATHHVKANLFYRGLRFLSHPRIGDTLTTVTEVVGLRENTPKPGRAPTGLAALHMVTTDQTGVTVLDFYRCAMLPLSPDADPGRTVHADDLSTIGPGDDAQPFIPEWDLDTYRESARGQHFSSEFAGRAFSSSADVVSSAPELARLSLNIAATHHDERVAGAAAGGRLVYGGHTIGLALAQANRALPNLVTVTGWDSCDHTGPVHEGDTLSSTILVEEATPLAAGGVLRLRSTVVAHGDDSDREVLDWRFRVLMA